MTVNMRLEGCTRDTSGEIAQLEVGVQYGEKHATIFLNLIAPVVAGGELSEAAKVELKALALREIRELTAAIHRVPVTID